MTRYIRDPIQDASNAVYVELSSMYGRTIPDFQLGRIDSMYGPMYNTFGPDTTFKIIRDYLSDDPSDPEFSDAQHFGARGGVYYTSITDWEALNPGWVPPPPSTFRINPRDRRMIYNTNNDPFDPEIAVIPPNPDGSYVFFDQWMDPDVRSQVVVYVPTNFRQDVLPAGAA